MRRADRLARMAKRHRQALSDAIARLNAVKLAPGRYLVSSQYYVELIGDSWRWYDSADPSRGGEWRRSKREAMLDLHSFLLLKQYDEDAE